MKGKDQNIKFSWPTKKNEKIKPSKYLFLQGKTKITDATVTIISRTTNFQVRQPVRKQPFKRLKVTFYGSSPQSLKALHRCLKRLLC